MQIILVVQNQPTSIPKIYMIVSKILISEELLSQILKLD